MFRIAFLLIACISITTISNSQENIVKKIRLAYIEYNTEVADAEKEGLEAFPPSFKIKNVQNRPALGPVSISIIYYYDEHSNVEEAEGYIDLKTEIVLRKIVYTEGMPSYTDYKETFYDEKGNLLFHYIKSTGYDCSEKRFYFDKGKLIKVKFNPIIHEQCSNKEESPSFTRYVAKLTKDDLSWEKWITEKSKQNKLILENLYNSTQ